MEAPAAEPQPAGRSRRRRVTSLRAFVVAFVLLVAAVTSVALAQFLASSTAAWASLGCSAAAVAVTLVSLVLPPS